MPTLPKETCAPCNPNQPPLNQNEINDLLQQVPGWELVKDKPKISRKFKFKDFKESIEFINKVADLAEEAGHHPDIHCFWNKVRLDLTTHAIGNLTRNDFIVAAKLNEIS